MEGWRGGGVRTHRLVLETSPGVDSTACSLRKQDHRARGHSQ